MSENEDFPRKEKLSMNMLLSHGAAWLFATLSVAGLLYVIW